MRVIFGHGFSRASFDRNESLVHVPCRALGEIGELAFPLPAGNAQREDSRLIWDSGKLVAGWARGRPGEKLEDSIGRLYDDMFLAIGRRSLYRIWHFIPRINACDSEMENYRLFCRARAEAFRRAFGPSFAAHLPAASAVGSDDDEPVILFAGGSNARDSVENPEQVPAYRYPPRYGPRSPSFARASRVNVGERDLVFISGTASIKGSETVHPGDCEKQTLTTLHNLGLISQSVGLDRDFGRSQGAARRFVVYVRRETDFPLVSRLLDERLLGPGDDRIFLRADICRSDLMVEIEATIVMPQRVARPLA